MCVCVCVCVCVCWSSYRLLALTLTRRPQSAVFGGAFTVPIQLRLSDIILVSLTNSAESSFIDLKV